MKSMVKHINVVSVTNRGTIVVRDAGLRARDSDM